MKYDHVVIGAGYAGLSAAERLKSAGRSVRVIDARPRVGGRSESTLNGLGERIDTGGQFVSDEMHSILELIDRYGGQLIAAHATGQPVGLPAIGDTANFKEAERIYYYELSALGQLAPEDASLSVADWMEREIANEGVRKAALSMAECANCTSADALPLKELLRMQRAGPEGFTEMQYFVEGSLHRIAESLAADLDCIDLEATVRAVKRSNGWFRIQTDNKVYMADSVIVATSPLQARQIVFQPALPEDLMYALNAFQPTDTFKFLIRYDRAFWRASGLNGLCQWSAPSGLWFGDSSPSLEKAMLVGFAGGPSAAVFRSMDAEVRRTTILKHLADALGDEAKAPLDYVERDWGNDLLGTGGYNAFAAGPYAQTAVARIRRGHEGIAFACTEIAFGFPGFIEGAIRTGREVASQMLS